METVIGASPPCIWMSAGLVRYKVCDRGLDCDGCLFDVAMRGELSSTTGMDSGASHREDGALFPGDRLYGRGHAWLQARRDGPDGSWRMGLDAFAAAIVGRALGVVFAHVPLDVDEGEVFCAIDLGLGVVPLSAPIPSHLLRFNERLQVQPELLVTCPYGRGWLVELQPVAPGFRTRLVSPGVARSRAECDLERFRHGMASRILDGEGGRASPLLPEGSAAVTDLRRLLVGPAYARLVGELVG